MKAHTRTGSSAHRSGSEARHRLVEASEASVNIRPGVGILALFPHMNYRAWYALGELVDNALDSYLSHRDELRAAEGPGYRLRVVIDANAVDGGYIRVWDNAAGINAADYQRAFVTAEPPPDSAGLSQFGIGMKSASCWFAREWRVRSTALGESVQRTIEFDVPRIVEENIESLPASIAEAQPGDHFTEVRLWNLYKPPQTQTTGKMKRHLASMYRQFLRSGDLILEFNGEELTFAEPKVLNVPHYKDDEGPARAWTAEVDFNLSTGERVHGFAAIRETGSTKDAGFSLYRHGRLIVGSDDDSYRPAKVFGGSNSFRSQRLFGEFHLDDFDVSHTKDGFIWEDKEDEVVDGIAKALSRAEMPLLQQAEGYRARKAPRSVAQAATKAVEMTVSVLPEVGKVMEAQLDSQVVDAPPPTTYGEAKLEATKTLKLVIKNEPWEISIDTTVDPAVTEWLTIRSSKPGGKKAPHQLGILLSVSHPFTQRFGGSTAFEIEGLVRLAAGLAIAETTARRAGGPIGSVRMNLNELLGGPLAQQ